MSMELRAPRFKPHTSARAPPPLAMHRVAQAGRKAELPWADAPVHPADFLQRLEQLEKQEATPFAPGLTPAAQPRKPLQANRSRTASTDDEVMAGLKELQDEIDRARARRSTPPEKRVGEGL